MFEDSQFQSTLAAAERSDAVAMYYVAEAYASGTGVSRDARAAVRRCTMAARDGVVDAMFELASYYLSGNGVPLEVERGEYWMARAYKTDRLRTVSPQRVNESRKNVATLVQAMQQAPSGPERSSNRHMTTRRSVGD